MTRLARALNSDDLRHREVDCDPDHLRAAGLTAIHKSLGVLLVEAKEGAAGDGPHAVTRVRELQIAVYNKIRRMAQRWKIKLSADGMAAKVVRELVIDRCNVCQGRGVIPMKYDGQRMVAVHEDSEGSARDVECTTCLGSGAAWRDYHGRARSVGYPEYTKRLSEFWEAVLSACCDAEISARSSMRRRLKR